jgi:PPM family protein phosphatase
VIDGMRDAPAAAPADATQAESPAPASASATVTGTESSETPAVGEAPQAPATAEGQPEAAPPAGERSEPLMEGARAGAFTIVRVLATNAEETRYLAREVLESGEHDQPLADGERADLYVTLIERAEGQLNSIAQRALLGLRHPRLLTARSAFSVGGRSYLALDTLVSPEGVPASTAGDGARLDAVATLTAGAGLADALAYLHRNEIAHLHVSPDVLVVHNGRAYLAGLETAEYVGALLDDGGALFARDANFLARSLGELAGLPTEASPDELPAEAALRSIVGHGAAGGFTAPADLAGACTLALQSAGPAPSLLAVEHPQERLLLEVGAATTVGLVRSENQDAYSSFICDLRDDVTKEAPFAVFIVADGMGGEARGEVASRIAARMVLSDLVSAFAVPALTRPAIMEMSEVPTAVLRAVSMKGVATDSNAASTGNGNDTNGANGDSAPEDELQRALKRAVAAANRQVRELASQLGQATGTTLTALVSLGSRAALAHLGDSRAYLLRGDLLAQLTEDHSVLARLQAIDHPLLSDPDVFVPRNMLYRSLGQEDDPNPDLVGLTLAVGDRLLICSDGLWDEIEPDALAQTLATAATPQQCAEQLVALANATGGHDNSTALVVFVQSAAEDSARRDEDSPAEPLSAAPMELGEQPSE